MEREPLSELSLAQLRSRRSEKWRAYPEDVLPLWVAEMDTPLAPPIRAALTEAIALGDTGYVHPGTLPEAYAEFSAQRFGWAPDPSAVALIPDVMQGVVAVLRQVTVRGDGVLINTPVYPPFFSFLRSEERRVVESPLATGPDGTYRLDLDRLRDDFASGGVQAYLLCNPHNPTGLVLSRDELAAVAELADRYGVRLLVDEIHAPVTYPGVRHVPMLSLAGDLPAAARGFAFVSASKAWNLPGLKAALAVAGPAARPELAAIPEDVRFGAGLFGVIASEAAFRHGGPWLADLLGGLDVNRQLLGSLLAAQLPEVGYRPPDATYLGWLDLRQLRLGADPAEVLLTLGKVALVAGHTFGEPGRGFVRFNLATSPELIREGVQRITRAVELSRAAVS